jgi:hypothetical protein
MGERIGCIHAKRQLALVERECGNGRSRQRRPAIEGESGA